MTKSSAHAPHEWKDGRCLNCGVAYVYPTTTSCSAFPGARRSRPVLQPNGVAIPDDWGSVQPRDDENSQHPWTYEVVVGNIGTVYSGGNLRDARFHARIYIDQSKSGYGRASGEPVTIFKDGEILEEYQP